MKCPAILIAAAFLGAGCSGNFAFAPHGTTVEFGDFGPAAPMTREERFCFAEAVRSDLRYSFANAGQSDTAPPEYYPGWAELGGPSHTNYKSMLSLSRRSDGKASLKLFTSSIYPGETSWRKSGCTSSR